MPNTIDQALEYARAHPRRDGGSWAGWCESFVWRAGGFDRSFRSALAAGNASGPLNPLWSAAPRGALHYWAGVSGNGHVAFELGGGTLLMASSRVSNLGAALGTIHFTAYGLPLYRGWTMYHGAQTLTAPALAGLDLNPLEPKMTPEQARMLQAIYDAIFDGGESMPDGGKAIGRSLADIGGIAQQILDRPQPGTVFAGGVPIDYAAIGAAVRSAIIKP